MQRRFLAVLAVVSLSASACAAPPERKGAAAVAGVALTRLKANAAAQQVLAREQRDNANRSATATAATTEGPRRDTELSSDIWRIGGTDADKRKLRTLEAVRSQDPALLVNPYLLLRPTAAPAAASVVIDSSGLDRAIKGVARLADEEGFSTDEAAPLLLDVIQKVEIPKALHADQ